VKIVIVEGESEKDKKKFSSLLMERKVLDFLSRDDFEVTSKPGSKPGSFQAKQLGELIRNPGDRNLVTPDVLDKVIELMEDSKSGFIRNFSAETCAEIFKKNPDLATSERTDAFLALADDMDPKMRQIFLKSARADVRAFKNLEPEMKVKIFSMLCDGQLEVREEARGTVRHFFGISPEVSKSLTDDMHILKFNGPQRDEAFKLFEVFSEGLEKRNLDPSAVFGKIAKLTKETEKHEFKDFKVMMHIAKNLLSGTGSAEEYNECLELSYKLYLGVNSRMNNTRTSVKVGGAEWGEILGKVFIDFIPELAENKGYAYTSMKLMETIEKIKDEEPEHLKRTILETLR